MEHQFPHLHTVKWMQSSVLDTQAKVTEKRILTIRKKNHDFSLYNTEAGNAVLSVLTGEFNPAGRLVVTWYTGNEQLPPMVSYSMVNRTYRYMVDKPQYHFGYGLSYTTFSYSSLKVVNHD